MKLSKIVMLPLDERPCNYEYPKMMPSGNFNLVLPPKDIMGDKKIAGKVDEIEAWLKTNCIDADALIVSLDTLIYGGILPSRLHHSDAEVLNKKADVLRQIKKENPNLKIYAFELIMRCPSYSSADEEPDYYELCGKEIHLYGRYEHKNKLGILTSEEEVEFNKLKKELNPEYLNDFLNRRKTNLAVLLNSLNLIKDGVVDYFIVPQDDASVYGFTSLDQAVIREYLKSNVLHMKTAMYPSADDTGLTLLARAVNEINGVKPKVYVKYSSVKGGYTVPLVEDRIVAETIKYHILAIGGIQVYSLPEADILMAVNVGSKMQEFKDAITSVIPYDVERNLAEFTNYIKYALSLNKNVCLCDVALLNKGDEELIKVLASENLLLKIHAYAGWNTSSNTIGTALCQSCLYGVTGDDVTNKIFLLHRYYEDVGYMAYARSFVTETVLPPLNLHYRNAGGKTGVVSKAVETEITNYMSKNYPEIAKFVEKVNVIMPWARMFEAYVSLDIKGLN